MLPGHLIVFAKEPRLGRVKTRLARDVGAVEATRFYRFALASLLRRLGRDPRWRTWLFVAPDSAAQTGYGWPGRGWPSDLPVRPQGTGDLGTRMMRAITSLPPGPVVLIGADIPGIEAHHIQDALARLGKSEAVFGPATDGGYWLVGLARRRPLPDLFKYVRWSSPTALADTLANLPKGKSAAFCATLSDVDDGGDYRRWRAGDQLKA